jgi:pSer/pThr/pTyr-binding forkhead associated (FHA) protein
VITCPVCKHSELDGTLFCSECGAALWGDAFTEDTATLKPEIEPLPATDNVSTLVIPMFAPPVGFSLRINGAKEQVQLTGKTEYLVGRSDPKHDVRPDLDLGPFGGQQLGVSRKHASLLQVDNGFAIRDLGSTNGTIVNGRVLAAGQDWLLPDGHEIRLGKLAMNIYFISRTTSP